MKPDRWSLIERLFHRAAERPPHERGRLLDEGCGGDATVREQVERLLAFDDETPSFIDVPALSPDDLSVSSGDSDPRVGHRVGAYKLLERVAVGGMGVVYRARRDDDLFNYPVAVKIVRRELGGEEVLRRFEVERQTLANLNHPNIARLLDGGIAEDGLPYLVMEFVAGVAIDVYCDDHRLTVSDRLKLFRTVCKAVQHAHQNLVIHRDLKPTNILVDAEGVPKLLDFGIAKLLDPSGVERTLDRTATAARMLTPDYASPEQIRGEPMSTATDVYSLGVVLYGLLTGRRPHRLTSARLNDMERAICDEEPVKPSTAIFSPAPPSGWRGQDAGQPSGEITASMRDTSPEKLRRQLRGDLDNIVMMALRKDASRRYASAEQFAADIDRYLAGLPIAARRDTIVYRSLKFIRRNRIGVAAAAIIFVAISVSALMSASMAYIAAQDRDAAQAAHEIAEHEARHARIESDSAHEVARILSDAFLISASGRDEANRDKVFATLEREAERVRRQFGDQHHLRANLIDAIGRIYLDLRSFEEAEMLIDEAMALRIATFGQENLEVARSLDSRGELHYRLGDFAAAEGEFRKALDLHRRLPVGVHTDIAHAADKLVAALRALGRLDEAQTLHEEAMAIRKWPLPNGPRQTSEPRDATPSSRD